MKRLRVTVNGKVYDVDVEVLVDDDEAGSSYGVPLPMNSAPRPAAPKPAPAASPSAAKAAISEPVKRGPSGSDKELTSPIAGTVTEIKVQSGDSVKENDLLMVLEAMKMNTHISSPISGRIKAIRVKEEEGVRQGQVLVEFE